MERCRDFQDQMLEFAYDLLDDDVRQALTLHLEDCDACQLALAQARQQQSRLARAARRDFAGVRFEAPTEAAQPATLTFPLPAPVAAPPAAGPVRRRSSWRLVRAAAVLLALTIPAALGLDYNRTRRDHERLAGRRDELKTQLAQLNDEVANLGTERERRLEVIDHEVRARQLRLVVSGPASIQAGASNEYEIQTRDGNDRAVPATIVAARVLDQTGSVLHEEKEVFAESGTHRLALPPSLPVKPHSQLSLQVIARRQAGSQSELSDSLALAAPIYLTHLTTDKPIYNPGETVRFRSLTLDRFSLAPAGEALEVYYSVTNPEGEEQQVQRGYLGNVRPEPDRAGKPVKGPDGRAVQGVGVGEWRLPPQAPGGEYVLTVRDAANRFPPQQRRFLVNNYQTPRLVKKLEFGQRSYGPGEEVVAQVEARTNGGAPLRNCPVEATLTADDQARTARFTTDGEGKAAVRLKLPASLERGQASLTVNFLDGGSPEPLLKPVPVVFDRLLVDFYPEGGDLVAGVPNRVYFQARTPQGRPADLRGRLVTDRAVVTEVRTLTDDTNAGVNQGQGVFTFTPQADRVYELAIDQPVGIKQRVKLPAAKDSGVVLSVPSGVTTAHLPIEVELYNVGKDRSLLVGAYCRGRLFDHRTLQAQTGEHYTLSLKPAEKLGGVYRITVFEDGNEGGRPGVTPLAERLIYRHQGERLNIELTPSQRTYHPGEQAKLKAVARGENQEPTPAVLMIGVTDRGAVSLADEKTARSMPTHFLLTSEVREPEELEHADFLLSPHPLAERALDLLLGTQGWRRFAEQKPADFLRAHPEEAARFLAAATPLDETLRVSRAHNTPEVQAFAQVEYQKLQDDLQRLARRLESEKGATRTELRQAESDPAFLATAAHLEGYHRVARWVQLLFPVVGLMLILGGVVALGRGLVQPVGRAGPLLTTAAACAALLVLLGVVAWVDVPTPGRSMSLDATQVAEAPSVQLEKATEAQARDKAAAKPTTTQPAAPRFGIGSGTGAAATGPQSPVPSPPTLGRNDDDRLKDGKGALRPMAPGGPGGQGGGRFVGDAKKAAEGKNEARWGDQERKQNRVRAMFDKGLGVPGRGGIEPKTDAYGAGGARPGAEAPKEMEADRSWAGGQFVVREYAHQRPPSKGRTPRSDATETVYWHPVLVLPDGRAEVSFGLSEQVTTYQVLAYGHTLDGRLAAATTTFDARLPFSLSAVTPPEVSSADRLQVPVTVTNSTARDQNLSVRIAEAQGGKLKESDKPESATRVPAQKLLRQLYHFQPSASQGEATLQFYADGGELGLDSLEKRIRIVPEGFPIVAASSGMLERSATYDVVLPAERIKGTLSCQMQVYPSTLANLQQGLEGLLREPAGCFEQSSTANYPNVLILQYLRATQQNQPEIEARARELLTRGYAKLTSFECQDPSSRKRSGYEWFGGTAPPHEALTAYGLLQFRDMASVHPVDEAMLARTKSYLLAQKDSKGGFRRNARAIDTFGRAPQEVTDAYIVWALTEGDGGEDVKEELTRLHKLAEKSDDAYFVALVANGLVNRGRTREGKPLLDRLAKAQKEGGQVEGKDMSITASRGRDLHIETTALAMLGWLKADPAVYRANLDKSLRWLAAQRGGSGTFGSTQATILALKALIRHAEAYRHKPEDGTLSLYVGDRLVARTSFTARHQEAITLDMPDAEQVLKTGNNRVRVEISTSAVLPCTLSWSYRTTKPVSDPQAPVRLSTKLARTTVREGESVRLHATLENVSGKGQGMAVAIVGLPAGLNLPEDFKQMKEHLRPGVEGGRPLVSMFEVRGRELILYWRDLAPGQKIEVPIDLVCRVPGEFSGPASRAYLYYAADHKHWIDPLRVKIQPAE